MGNGHNLRAFIPLPSAKAMSHTDDCGATHVKYSVKIFNKIITSIITTVYERTSKCMGGCGSMLFKVVVECV